MQAEHHLCYSDRTGWKPNDVFELTLIATGDKDKARAARMDMIRAQLEQRLNGTRA